MEPVVEISGHTKLTCLIGNPVEHSMSPALHNASFAKAGVDAAYVAFTVNPEQLEPVVRGLKEMGVAGYNVTMPCKTHILQYLDELTPAAELMGAVNTVAVKDGKCIGHNTDGAGFVENLRLKSGDVAGKKVTILGAGGAGSAIFTQLALDKVANVNVFNMKDGFWDATEKRAAALTEKTGTPVSLHDLANREELAASIADSDILINATRVGMKPDVEGCLIDEEMLHDGLVVADTVYEPHETKLIKMAKAKGLTTAPGLGMLLHQAALGEKIWFDIDMDVDYIAQRFFN